MIPLKAAKLLEHISNKGFVNKQTRPFLLKLTYYNYLWFCRDLGLIKCDGIENNNEKRWILTEKGKDLVNHLKEMEKILDVGES